MTKPSEKAAEDWAFNYGIAHGKRDMPAWHYSLIDFKAGVAWAVAQLRSEEAKEASRYWGDTGREDAANWLEREEGK